MTDHKFTDEEVIKALECCVQGDSCLGCCPYDDGDYDCAHCTSKLARDALNLINRQKAEIERLYKEIERISKTTVETEVKERSKTND